MCRLVKGVWTGLGKTLRKRPRFDREWDEEFEGGLKGEL